MREIINAGVGVAGMQKHLKVVKMPNLKRAPKKPEDRRHPSLREPTRLRNITFRTNDAERDAIYAAVPRGEKFANWARNVFLRLADGWRLMPPDDKNN